MIRKYARNIVEKIPFWAMTYRIVHDELTFTRARPVMMPQGFRSKEIIKNRRCEMP